MTGGVAEQSRCFAALSMINMGVSGKERFLTRVRNDGRAAGMRGAGLKGRGAAGVVIFGRRRGAERSQLC